MVKKNLHQERVMKKVIFNWAFIAACGCVSALQAQPAGQSAPAQPAAPAAPAQPAAPAPNCLQLTPAEQNFAGQLTPANQGVFCNQMTVQQRQQAMQMANTPDPSGNLVTPDQAVQSVMQHPSASKKVRRGGGCPVQ